MRTNTTSLPTAAYVIGLSVVVLFLSAMSVWTDRTLDFWLTYFKGEPVNVPFWLSFVTTIVGNAVVLGVNVASEIARLCI